MKPHLEGINRLAAKAQEERGHDRSMMLWFLNQGQWPQASIPPYRIND